MEELLVVGGGFDGVADGVAEVEDHAEAGFFFVFADDIGFDADAGGDDAGESGGFACEDGFGVLLHVAEELCIVDDAGFDGFLQACVEFGGGKSAEKIYVGEDSLRMVEAADEIFSCGEIDSGFSADGGVDLRQERRRDLDVADAPHVNGSEEAGDVAEDSATEGEEERVAVGSGVGELVGEGFDVGEAFVAFAAREKKNGRGFFVVFWKRCEEGFRPESPDLRRSNDEGPEWFVFADSLQARVEGAK